MNIMEMEEMRARTASSGYSGKFESKVSKHMQPSPQDILVKDGISELPDEILVGILSQLKMKEAGRTSLLSKRWTHVWTSINNLDFDASETLQDFGRNIKCLEVERPIYASCVNEAISHHQGLSIDEFMVVFCLDESFSSDIDNWISFALGKRVQKLKLDLRNEWRSFQRNRYKFPQSHAISSYSLLTSLQLFGVNISGEVLQLFFYNCPNLEVVSVSASETLVNLNVDGPSLKLKCLELTMCHNMKCLKISAPGLVSFKYIGPRIEMPLINVPMLLEISIRGAYSQKLTSSLSEFSSYVSQLETLTLETRVIQKHIKDDKFPEFTKLKHLSLVLTFPNVRGILGYTSLIEASPSLNKVTVKMPFAFSKPETTRDLLKAESRPHNIKVVQFDGFHGHAVDAEFALYLIENAVMLEKITFDTRCPLSLGTWFELSEELGNRDRPASRECARRLVRGLTAGAEVVIL